MTANIPYIIGTTISIAATIAIVIWAIWALIKYKPFSVLVKMLYDIRYFVLQVVLMYSNKQSIFSLKRFNSGLILYWAIVTCSLFIRKKTDLSPEGLMLIVIPLLGLGGYNLYQIQKEKRSVVDEDLNNRIVDNATEVANKIVDNDSKEN
jgi:hypothetical protein